MWSRIGKLSGAGCAAKNVNLVLQQEGVLVQYLIMAHRYVHDGKTSKIAMYCKQ